MEEDQVRSLYKNLLEAWNRRDAGAMAALFSPDGNVIGFDGSQLDGPAVIESTLSMIFARHPTPPFVEIVREVRFPASNVAVVRAVVGMVPVGESRIKPALNAIQTLVAQRRDGHWTVAVFQNTPAAFHGLPEKIESLTQELQQAYEARR